MLYGLSTQCASESFSLGKVWVCAHAGSSKSLFARPGHGALRQPYPPGQVFCSKLLGSRRKCAAVWGVFDPFAWPRVTITPPLLTRIQMASPRLSLVSGEITWKAVACSRDSREQAYGRVSVSRHLALEPSLSPSSSPLVIARK